MNIIFGEEVAKQVGLKHVVLELDTIRIGGSEPVIAYCVVETIPPETIPVADTAVLMHVALITNYKGRNWEQCELILKDLFGTWGADMDTFYLALHKRIAELKTATLDDTWSPIIQKSI